MILSIAKETIFIHVPKCAGTSMKNALKSCGFRLTHVDVQPDDIRSGFYKNGTAARMRKHIDPDLWQRSMKFAVCRNPYDRLVSGWNFCRKQGHLDVPFDYFVRNLGTYRAFWIDWHCVMPQLQHLLIDGAPIADHVCRFESLHDDLEVIRRRLDRPDLTLPHLNKSSDGRYQERFTRELQDITFERFAVDFEYFGYGYDL